MKTHILATAALFVLTVSAPVWAQDDGPSLEDTVEFIKRKIEDTHLTSTHVTGVLKLEGRQHRYSVDIDPVVVFKCDVAFLQKVTWGFTRTAKKGWLPWHVTNDYMPFALNLGELSASEVRSEEFDPHADFRKANEQAAADIGEEVTTADEGRKFAVVLLPERSSKKVQRLVVETPELAERVAKAFAHGSKLCGGKDEPF